MVTSRAMFLYFAIPAVVIVVVLILLVLFEPGLDYAVEAPVQPIDSDDFLCLMGALSDAQVRRDSRVDVLTNGTTFYEAQLEAIRNAKRSINLEAYIFRNDAIGRRFVEALAARARAGVSRRGIKCSPTCARRAGGCAGTSRSGGTRSSGSTTGRTGSC